MPTAFTTHYYISLETVFKFEMGTSLVVAANVRAKCAENEA